MARIVGDLVPEDDYTHPLGPEPNFNESMYFNFFDRGRKVGGFVRLGNRANEGPRGDDDDALPAGRSRALQLRAPADLPQRRLRRRRHALRGPRADAAPAHALRGRAAGAARAARHGRSAPRLPREPAPEGRARSRARRGRPDVRRSRGPRGERARRLAAVRQGPLRAAHGREGRALRRRRDASRSRASACATTPGVRATGRRSTPTSGSPSTSAPDFGAMVSIIRRDPHERADRGRGGSRRLARSGAQGARRRPSTSRTTSTTAASRCSSRRRAARSSISRARS